MAIAGANLLRQGVHLAPRRLHGVVSMAYPVLLLRESSRRLLPADLSGLQRSIPLGLGLLLEAHGHVTLVEGLLAQLELRVLLRQLALDLLQGVLLLLVRFLHLLEDLEGLCEGLFLLLQVDLHLLVLVVVHLNQAPLLRAGLPPGDSEQEHATDHHEGEDHRLGEPRAVAPATARRISKLLNRVSAPPLADEHPSRAVVGARATAPSAKSHTLIRPSVARLRPSRCTDTPGGPRRGSRAPS
mmetsp:Transcript_48800/g.156306  ORF Transcript_48800/g.156306 Transcript_48800/m.156306 type:complete len:242 (+) Transcript_48800:1225-1950(+)